jgi:hypothetical protein
VFNGISAQKAISASINLAHIKICMSIDGIDERGDAMDTGDI